MHWSPAYTSNCGCVDENRRLYGVSEASWLAMMPQPQRKVDPLMAAYLMHDYGGEVLNGLNDQ
jgi:hypothetical protein